MKSPIFHVAANQAGQPLLTILRRWRAAAERSLELLRARRIQLNGNLCVEGARLLKAGDVVKILPHAAPTPPRADDIVVRYIDAHLVVVDKPSGMTTMRYGDEVSASGRKDRLPTLLELMPQVVARHLKEAAGEPARKGDRGKPGGSRLSPPPGRRHFPKTPVFPVHRLDRETSGLMVFARTKSCEEALTQLFREHAFERTYRAVVQGRPEPSTIETWIAEDRGDGRRGSVSDPDLGQRAVTRVVPLEPLGEQTLVECRLETGRTHQIRIHLSEAGHPLCGDRQYRGPMGKAPHQDTSAAPRLLLHAAELRFRHPATGQTIDLESPLPQDFARFVKRLRFRRDRNPDGSGGEAND